MNYVVVSTRSVFLCGLISFIVLVGLTGCSDSHTPVEPKEEVSKVPPSWAKNAIWYQIFVERFHNGDPSNDPTIQNIDGTYPGFVPDTWQTTPWTQDWYKEDDYFAQAHGKPDFNGWPVTNFDAKTALRRYGGDLQGVLDKLDYLSDLGINAIYFNPINDAPSMHKYDARHWRHVDVNFGPNPQADIEIIANEDPADPSTWEFTHADKMFLDVIKQAKARGIRVILDYSWNHTGHTFWAWQDLLKNQQESDYADWYWVKEFDNPATEENEFEYRGWFGVFDLPEIKETNYADHSQAVTLMEGDIYHPDAKAHILAVTQRWLDPNGDGDPSDGVDGYRLDVAAEVPLGFWRDYRKLVKTINPQAYLIGEIWWEKFPDDLFDPLPVLQGDVFDAVMNYRWYRSARKFFAQAPSGISPSEFVQELQSISSNLAPQYNYAMMNMSASHDSPRLLTSMYNNNKYKYNAKESQDASYKGNKPDQHAHLKAKLLLAHQFTYIGAPQIWAGDEMGMWGTDDPHNRKPLMWPELTFEDESSHPQSKVKEVSKVMFDASLFAYYQSLVKLRSTHPVLSNGDINFSLSDNKSNLFGYERFNESGNRAFVAFNLSTKVQTIILPRTIVEASSWLTWDSQRVSVKKDVPAETIILAPQSAFIVLTQ